jgi:hypothetical protein
MISNFLNAMGYTELVIFYCTIGAVTMYGTFFLVRRLAPRLIAQDIDSDFISGLYAALFTITFLTLGYGLVNASETVDRFQQNVEIEANDIRTLDFLLSLYGLDERETLRQDLREYVESIVKDEWPLLSKGMGSNQTRAIQRKFRAELTSLDPTTGKELAIYSEILEVTDKVIQARSSRISDSNTKVAPQFMLASNIGYICVLLISAIMLTQFTWVKFVGLNIQIFAVSFIFAATIALDNPFLGVNRITSDPLAALLNDAFPSIQH